MGGALWPCHPFLSVIPQPWGGSVVKAGMSSSVTSSESGLGALSPGWHWASSFLQPGGIFFWTISSKVVACCQVAGVHSYIMWVIAKIGPKANPRACTEPSKLHLPPTALLQGPSRPSYIAETPMGARAMGRQGTEDETQLSYFTQTLAQGPPHRVELIPSPGRSGEV